MKQLRKIVSPFKVTSALVAPVASSSDGLRRVRHDLVVGVHGLLGVLGIVCDLAAVDDLDLIAGVPGVDLLDGHINGVLCALAVNGGAAGHGADNAHTNDVVFLAIRCGSGAGRGLTGSGRFALLGAGAAACQQTCGHGGCHGKC